jgi:hypothetical protein
MGSEKKLLLVQPFGECVECNAQMHEALEPFKLFLQVKILPRFRYAWSGIFKVISSGLGTSGISAPLYVIDGCSWW